MRLVMFARVATKDEMKELVLVLLVAVRLEMVEEANVGVSVKVYVT